MKNDKRPLINEEQYDDTFFTTASSGDCTGLIPEGGNLTEEEFIDYKEVYPFSVPQMPENDKGR